MTDITPLELLIGPHYVCHYQEILGVLLAQGCYTPVSLLKKPEVLGLGWFNIIFYYYFSPHSTYLTDSSKKHFKITLLLKLSP